MANIHLSVNAEFFGTEWAASDECQQEVYAGIITKWNKKAEDTVYIKWEGWSRATSTELSHLVGKDDKGAAIKCQLLAYEDGRAPPVYVPPAAPGRHAASELPSRCSSHRGSRFA